LSFRACIQRRDEDALAWFCASKKDMELLAKNWEVITRKVEEFGRALSGFSRLL